jgi:tyrosinase
MWSLKSVGHRYEKVESDDLDQKKDPERLQRRAPPRCLLILGGVLTVTIILVIAALVAIPRFAASLPSADDNKAPSTPEQTSSNGCPLRREWRTLSSKDQQSYITSVICLLNTTSKLFPPDSGKTAYIDFPWIHSRVGYFTHSSAPFLPWHRYFLHVYETTLRTDCGYEGSLPYWDWTLDSDAVENSPVFDPETGFGGDGEVGGEITVSNTGRCVVDGPFAGLVEPEWYDVKYLPHCLSRGFRDLEGNLGHIDGSDITPESIEEVLSVEGYEPFVTLMESRVHDAIPYGISGDFETFTAPYGTYND